MADEASAAQPSSGPGRGIEFRRRLNDEVQTWVRDGLITVEQAGSILDRYQGDEPDVTANPLSNRVVTVVAVMGAVLIGLGIIAFIAANWSEISPWGRLALMAVGTPTIYAVGWLVAYRFAFPRIGTALILLGAIAYGASIHLIAQTYHVPVNHPNLVALWFLGVAPIAYIVRSRPVAALMLILFIAAAGFRSQEWFPGFDEEVLFLMPPMFLVLAAALFAVGRLQSRFGYTSGFSVVFVVVAGALAGVAVYVLSYSAFWEEVARDHQDGVAFVWPEVEYWVVMAASGLIAIASILVGARRFTAADRGAIRWEFGTIIAVGVVVAIALAAMLAGDPWVWVVFNLVILAAVVGLVAAGYRLLRADLINVAIAVFAVMLFTRYFEFGFGLLQQSVAFIVTGVLLLGVGFGLEILRRRMVQRMRSQVL